MKKILYRKLKILGIMLTEVSLIMTMFASISWAGKPIRMAITDLEGLEQLQREFGAFRDLLSKKTGLAIKFFPVASRTAAVEAMRSKKIDFAIFSKIIIEILNFQETSFKIVFLSFFMNCHIIFPGNPPR